MEITDKMSPEIRNILNMKLKGIVRFGSGFILIIIVAIVLAYFFKEDIEVLNIFHFNHPNY